MSRLIFVAPLLVVLAACSRGSVVESLIPRATLDQKSVILEPQPSTQRFSVIHTFGDVAGDGLYPSTDLIQFDGALYGTTEGGGHFGSGTVYSVTPKGVGVIWHSFNYFVGGDPNGLMTYHGSIYGTTDTGGTRLLGTVYRMSPSGRHYETLYSFDISPDGNTPQAGLLQAHNIFYGTTVTGGLNRHGTVYKITKEGAEQVMHSFGTDQGRYPKVTLIAVHGTLYGTTPYGGHRPGYGTFFALSPSGSFKTLHAFDGKHGGQPEARLLYYNGQLYGTSLVGGEYGVGVIFVVTLSGKYKVLYNFGTTPDDGCHPAAGLIGVKGSFYGTTDGGDEPPCSFGTVFRFTPPSEVVTLHKFVGKYPFGGIRHLTSPLYTLGRLYGTAAAGGRNNEGLVYSIAP